MTPQAIAAPNAQPATARHMPRLPVLDGWRGLSIVLVIICHVIPFGLPNWSLNFTLGMIGMAIFFTLSGFLIVSTLYFDPSIRNFTIRRLSRILPLAWLFLLITLPFLHVDQATLRANFLFYANIAPIRLTTTTAHFWSLCLEVQFYVAMALAFAILRRRAFWLLPFACLAITAIRIAHHEPANIESRFRADEILSGATLAWLFHSRHSAWLQRALTWLNPIVPITLLCLAGHPAFRALNYARPYFAAIAVGTTFFHPRTLWSRFFESRTLAWLATISYALYVWQPLTTHPPYWPEGPLTHYLFVELGLPFTFFIAWCSTHYYERFWINLGKRFLTTTRMTEPLAKPQRP